MNPPILKAGRLSLRRSVQRRQNPHFKVTKNQKSTTPDRPSEPVNATVEDPAAGKTIPAQNNVSPLPLWQRLGPLSTAFHAYGRSQKKRPYITQVCSSLVIYFCGDLSAQNIGGEDYSPRRTLRALVIGGLCSIPSYKWFMWLGRNFNYASKTLSLGTKVVVNQIAFTPIFNSYFFGAQSLLSGDSLAGAWERITRTVPISFINSCKLWPAVTAFSFTYISPQHRSIFAGFIAIGWQTYLSYLNQQAAEEEKAKRRQRGSPDESLSSSVATS